MPHPANAATVESLRQVSLFAPLGDIEIEQLAALVEEREVARGQFLTHEGLPAEAMYIVASGRFKRFKTLERREQILTILGPGDTFGEVPVLDGGPSPASTQALEEGKVYLLTGDELERMVRDSPDLAMQLIRSLARRLRHLTELTGDLGLRRTVERVARLILARDLAGDLDHLTQSDMAALAGTAREVVGRALHQLEQRGAIQVRHGRITVQDRELLEAVAESAARRHDAMDGLAG